MLQSKTLSLKFWPDPILKTACTEATDYDEAIEVGLTMTKIMRDNGGIGLAAPQAGYDKRVIVLQYPDSEGHRLILVNPVIIDHTTDVSALNEGCLSFPGSVVNILRFDSIVVQARTAEGTTTIPFEGIYARCVQHEIDHLNGVMIFDHAKSNIMRRILLDKYFKSRR